MVKKKRFLNFWEVLIRKTEEENRFPKPVNFYCLLYLFSKSVFCFFVPDFYYKIKTESPIKYGQKMDRKQTRISLYFTENHILQDKILSKLDTVFNLKSILCVIRRKH